MACTEEFKQLSQISFEMSSSPANQSKSQKSLAEVVSTEKRLLPLIYSKGILHGDILELYHDVRAESEKIIFHSYQMAEIQEVEYFLWKLHYKLINEFRKRIGQQSSNKDNIEETNPQSVYHPSESDRHLEGFKAFLAEAAQFYGDLILKLKQNCGLPEDVVLDHMNASSSSVEPTKLHKCQFTCHRLLTCLGDFARYEEILKNPDARNWCKAATYYLEATTIWPDSGNPHNQLALLATYVGDSFLALYHCLRSLEVKDPFPDAWRNLVLLFEENKSTPLPLSNIEVLFDFYNLYGSNFLQNKSTTDNGAPAESKLIETKNPSTKMLDLWPSVIRTISFFIIRSSLKEFSSTFAHTLSSLEALLVVDDAELTATMESYELMDSLRTGPYRSIQLVSVFIFMLHGLIKSPKLKYSAGVDEIMQSEYAPLAWAVVFICMGRLTERCQKSDLVKCPLLPAVLVFVEWLVGALGEAEKHVSDERVANAMSYFFDVLSEFLNRHDQNESEITADNTALWEDHELRGFYPLVHVHEMLDFAAAYQEWRDDSDRRRTRRIFHASIRIAGRAKSSPDWILYDNEGRNFYCSKKEKCLGHKKEKCLGQGKSVAAASGSCFGAMITAEKSATLRKAQSMSAEDDEVILFKPITRHNSAPIYTSQSRCRLVSPEATDTQGKLLDEFLHRATTFSHHQSEDDDSFSFCSTLSDSGQHRPFKDLASHPTGPPSLSAWVLDKGRSKYETDKGTKDSSNYNKLIAVEEIAFTSLSDLSISERNNSEVAPEPTSIVTHGSPPYVAPLPSAPCLPENAAWLKMNPLISPEFRNEADGIVGTAAYTNGVSTRAPVGFTPPRVSGLVDCYPPPNLGMSSSEWLYYYRNSQNASNRISTCAYYGTPTFENLPTSQVSRFDLYDQCGNRLVSSPLGYMGSPYLYPNSSSVYGSADQEQTRNKVFTDYQRPVPYLYGVDMEFRQEQPPYLQYLKERQWQLQPELHLNGRAFVGN